MMGALQRASKTNKSETVMDIQYPIVVWIKFYYPLSHFFLDLFLCYLPTRHIHMEICHYENYIIVSRQHHNTRTSQVRVRYTCSVVMVSSSIHWFRKGLRLHDNPALVEAVSSTDRVFPLFVMDPWFAKPDKIGGNRYEFLLQSLRDLDESLREIGTRLYVVKGKPDEQIPRLCKKWDVSLVTFEKDSEPYAVARDAAISNFCTGQGIKTATFCSHTLYEPSIYIDFNKGDVPKSYQSFNTIFAKLSSSSSSSSTSVFPYFVWKQWHGRI